MLTIRPERILTAIPSATTVVLPENWFDHLSDDISVYESLYRWMVSKRRVSPVRLHNRTYAGATVAKQLLTAERRRISKRLGLRGQDLDRSVNFSDLNSGPHTLFAERRLLGKILVVIPEEDDEALQNAISALLKENWETSSRKIRETAAGSDFGQWLLSNIGREDPIGDIALDASHDSKFPLAAKSYRETLTHMQCHGACDGAIAALADAWLEYSERYPDRVVMSIWCEACEGQISPASDGAVAYTRYGGLQMLHKTCLQDDLDEDEPATESIELSSDDIFGDLCDLAARNDIPSVLVSTAERNLRLSGFRARGRDQKANVYFIQSGTTGPIKIGYSAGPPGRRLAALQTGHPEPLRLLATIEGGRETEINLHRRFAAHRKTGEWFEPHPDVIQFIAVIAPRGTRLETTEE